MKGLFVLINLISWLALAQKVEAARGFIRTDSPYVSEVFKHSGKSVFRILTPHNNFNVLPGNLDLLRKEIERRTATERGVAKGENSWFIQQLQFCIDTEMSPCLASSSYREAFSGSAFIAGRDNLLWTAGHNVIRYFKALEEHQVSFKGVFFKELSQIPIFFRLEGMRDLVSTHRYYSSAVDGIAYLLNDLSKINLEEFTINGSTHQIARPLSFDIAIFRMPMPLPYLRFSTNLDSEGKMFIQGFPSATFGSGRENLPKTDSNGSVQYLSDGSLFHCQKDLHLHAYGGFMEAALHLIRGDENGDLICSDVDAVAGNSGGPVLDELGEVVGMVLVAWPNSRIGVKSTANLSVSQKVLSQYFMGVESQVQQADLSP